MRSGIVKPGFSYRQRRSGMYLSGTHYIGSEGKLAQKGQEHLAATAK
jgi:hypothetical protein